MFRPNLVGSIKSGQSRDVHGRVTFSDPVDCPFAIVDLIATSAKTTVRADSSASRGSADEEVTKQSVILTPSFIPVDLGDVFTFRGVDYELVSVQPQYGVCGDHDHNELGLQFYLG